MLKKSCGVILALAVVGRVWAAPAAPGVTIWEAEESLAKGAQRFADPQASGKSCAGVIFTAKGNQPAAIFARAANLAPGLYEVTFWLDALPLAVMHELAIHLSAAQESRVLHTIHFEGRGGYRPVTLQVRHGGGAFAVKVAAQSGSGFNGMRAGQDEDERSFVQSAPTLAAQKHNDTVLADLAEFDAIVGEQDVRDPALAGHRVWCDKVAIRQLAEYGVPLTLTVDKIHYRPGEGVNASYTIGAQRTTEVIPVQLDAELVSELDDAVSVWRGTAATAGGSFAFTLPPQGAFGRELRLRASVADRVLGEAVALFGVSSNVYLVGITGRGAPANTQNYSMERARADMAQARAQYANYFERFAWAPCDYSDLDPQEELFYSGQTQYPGSRQGVRNMLDAAHEVGIKGITYGKACGGGIAGFNTLQRHPEFFARSRNGFACEALNVFFLERMLANGYNNGAPEDGGWQHWASIWTNYEENPDTVTFGAEAVIASTKRFGWDGIRWDGHFVGHQKPFIERLRAFDPAFVHGYNIAFVNPAADHFLPPDQTDFHDVAAGGGLMMDESARDWSNTGFSSGDMERFYRGLCREADYIKAIDGLPLIITFDMASNLDRHLNVLMALAAGQRYTYLTSPGDYAYGSLAKWLTRFSALVWDGSRRFDAPAITVATAPEQSLFWKESVWLRHVGGTKWQVLTAMVNQPLYRQFCNRVQPPPVTATNLPVHFQPPAGAALGRAFYASPELAAGWQPLAMTRVDGAAAAHVPELHAFGIVGFEFAWSGEGTPFKLRDPVAEAAALLAQQDEAKKRQAEEARAKAAIAATPVRDEPAVSPDEAYLQKHPMPPAWRLARDGRLDVLHARGPFSWLNPVESATALVSGARFTPSWVNLVGFKLRDGGCMDEYPESWDELARHDVVVLDNVHARFLGTANRARLATFVRQGGGLLVFGGYWNLGAGTDAATALAGLLPLDLSVSRPPVMFTQPQRLEVRERDFFAGVDFTALGGVLCCDTSPLRDDPAVLATVGGHPAIVSHRVGQGRVIVVMFNPHGPFAATERGYWQSVEWLKVINACLRWLGADAEADDGAVAGKRKVTAGKPLPQDLLVQAAFGMDAAVFTKKLSQSVVNIIDSASAKAALEALAENADKVDDPELPAAVVAAAAPFFGRDLASVGAALCANTLPELRAAGYAILGRSADQAYGKLLQGGLGDRDAACVREAVIGLGRLGDDAAREAVAVYLQRGGSERLLALTTLLRLGADRHLSAAWAAYEAGLQRAVDLKCGTFQIIDYLWGGTSFKLTPIQRKQGMADYRRIRRLRQEAGDDIAFFNSVALTLKGDALRELAACMAASEKREIAPLAFALAGAADAEEAAALRAAFKDAKIDTLRLLGHTGK